MKNFEMPKMNISIFSSEDIITTSVAKADLAQRALAAAGADDVTTTTAASWSEWVQG